MKGKQFKNHNPVCTLTTRISVESDVFKKKKVNQIHPDGSEKLCIKNNMKAKAIVDIRVSVRTAQKDGEKLSKIQGEIRKNSE